jgi:hypothetical protein
MKVVTTIKMTGPFFEHDPKKTFRQNVRSMMDAISVEAERDVQAQMRVGEASRAPISLLGDRVADHVRSRTTNLAGHRWAVTAVVSVNNRNFGPSQGIALMAAAATVERDIGAFRKMTSRMRRARAVNQAELLKGLQ